jgi:hypothetical protein
MRRICATLAGTGSLAAVGTDLHVPPVPERIDNPAGPRPVILKRDGRSTVALASTARATVASAQT